MGIALAELIAYVGDSLSYKQDAVATEAYLQTARSRISLRRHALLVDYHVHDGCNARAWIHLHVTAQVLLDHTKTRFYTTAPGMPSDLKVGSGNERAALAAGVIVFEPMQDAQLFPEHNQMSFYTWGDDNCCLPKGATEATLLGTFSNLQPGDVLIFQEMMGPQTGNPADADIRHRCAVRLTQVTTQDAQGHPLVDPLFEDGTGAPITSAAQKPTPVTEIQWSQRRCSSVSGLHLQQVPRLEGEGTDADRRERGLRQCGAGGSRTVADRHRPGTGSAAEHLLSAQRSRGSLQSQSRGAGAGTIPSAHSRQPGHSGGFAATGGRPVTPAIVYLLTNSFVTLTDAERSDLPYSSGRRPCSWPNFMGVTATQNAVHPANFDLSVVYDPPGGASGLSAPPVLETLYGFVAELR